jgi:hypothetical protein
MLPQAGTFALAATLLANRFLASPPHVLSMVRYSQWPSSNRGDFNSVS